MSAGKPRSAHPSTHNLTTNRTLEIRSAQIEIGAKDLAEGFLKSFVEFDFYFLTGRQTPETELRNPTAILQVTLEKTPQGQHVIRIHDQQANANTDTDATITTDGVWRAQVLGHLLEKERLEKERSGGAA